MELKELLNEGNNYTHISDNFSIKRKFNTYISRITFEQKGENFIYIGGVNLNFERSEIGIYQYQNGDIYFGHWNRNIKDGLGIFYSKSPFRDEQKKIFYNFYIGNWQYNTKHGNGIYLRILMNPDLDNRNNNKNDLDNSIESQEASDVSNFLDLTNKKEIIISNKFVINPNEIEKFEIFCGLFKEDEYQLGLNYFISENNEECVYYGRMNDNYEKEDDDGLMITRHNKFIYKGKFSNNKFISGYVFNVNDETNKMFYVEYEDGEIVEFRNKNLIENYDTLLYEMLTKYVNLNEIEGFNDIQKYANLTNYYVDHLINFDFGKFDQNLDFLREHILYFKDLFDNIMNSVL